jgi:predicted Zn-dependent protease
LPVTVIGTHGDIDRVLAAAREVSTCVGRPGQANGDVLSVWLHGRRWRPRDWKGVAMLIVSDDIGFHGDEFIFGQSDEAVGGMVSTFRFARDERVTDRIGLFETLVMHELGHALGAADPDRDSQIQMWFGPHCMNPCVMRQRDDLPQFEADVLPVLATDAPFCAQCRDDVRKFLGGHLA